MSTAESSAWLARNLTALPAAACPGVRLWLLDLREAAPAAALAWLSAAEQARAARWVFERDRRRFCAARAGLRHVLAVQQAGAPAGLDFVFGAHGKPRLAGPVAGRLRFNLSHSADVALIGVALDADPVAPAGELGVDIEVMHAIDDLAALAQAHFTPAEVADLAAVGDLQARPVPTALMQTFLQGWTRKEACLKAVGTGFSVPAHSFHGGVHRRPGTADIPTPGGVTRVHVQALDLGPKLLAAVAWTL